MSHVDFKKCQWPKSLSLDLKTAHVPCHFFRGLYIYTLRTISREDALYIFLMIIDLGNG